MKRKIYLMCVILWGCFIQNVFSQGVPECDVLYCNTDIHVSVDENCEAEISPYMIIGGHCTLTNFQLTLTDQSGDPVPNPVPIEYVNQTIVAELIAWDLDDTCTTNIVIDDKYHPVINGISGPLILSCLEDLGQQFTLNVTENCDYNIEISDIIITGDGDPIYTVDITFTVTDIGGNQDSETITVDLENFWDIIEWPLDYVAVCEDDLINAATPIITIPPECPRDVEIEYVDYRSGCQINRVWTVTDVFSGLNTSYTQSLNFENQVEPVIIVDDEYHISLKQFNAGWDFDYEVIDDCNSDVIVYVSRDIFPISCSPEYFKIIYSITAFDDCGNEANRQVVVHVKAKQKPKVTVKGKKSCYDPFIISTRVVNMTPPYQYDYTVNNLNWGIVDLGNGRARVFPGKGKVIINVEVTDQGGCTAQDDIKYACNKFVPLPFGASMDDLNLYPNPTTGMLFISGDGMKDIFIYNIDGKLIKSYSNFTEYEIDITDLDNGTYIVKIKTPEEVISLRMVKI